MVAPLIAAAGRAVAEGEIEKKSAQKARKIEKNYAQHQALVRNAKNARQAGYVAGNDNEKSPANDNQAPHQERVGRLRFNRAQVLLASREKAEQKIEEEQKQKPSLIRYMPAFMVATLKDSLDLIAIGSLPVIGTMITFCCSLLIFILTILAKKNGSFQDMRFVIRRLLVIIVGFMIEGFAFGVNFFPFEIATVVVIYLMDTHLSLKQIAFFENISQNLSKKRW